MTAPACGREIFIKDWQRSIRARYLSLCGERWLKIANGPDATYPDHAPNGMYMAGWQGVAEDIIGYVPVRHSRDELRLAAHVDGAGPDGFFHSILLKSVVDFRELAALVGVDHKDMQDLLSGYALIRDEP